MSIVPNPNTERNESTITAPPTPQSAGVPGASPAVRPVLPAKATASENSAVRIITRAEGNTTHFLVDNRELCEVTMSFGNLVALLPEFPCIPLNPGC